MNLLKIGLLSMVFPDLIARVLVTKNKTKRFPNTVREQIGFVYASARAYQSIHHQQNGFGVHPQSTSKKRSGSQKLTVEPFAVVQHPSSSPVSAHIQTSLAIQLIRT